MNEPLPQEIEELCCFLAGVIRRLERERAAQKERLKAA